MPYKEYTQLSELNGFKTREDITIKKVTPVYFFGENSFQNRYFVEYEESKFKIKSVKEDGKVTEVDENLEPINQTLSDKILVNSCNGCSDNQLSVEDVKEAIRKLILILKENLDIQKFAYFNKKFDELFGDRLQ